MNLLATSFSTSAFISSPCSPNKDKSDQLLQPLLGEPSNPLEQAPPDLPVTDQPVQATVGPAAVEKGFWVHRAQDGENLSIREALKSRLVLPIQQAVAVCLAMGVEQLKTSGLSV